MSVNVSPKMHEELILAANWYQNARGVVAMCGRRTEDALIRRGLITYDTHQPDSYPVITVKGWEYLASAGYKRRAEDPGRLTLDEALSEAYPVPATPQNTNKEDSLPIDNGPLTERAEVTNAPARVRTEDLAPGDRVWGDRNFIEVGPYPHELELNPWNTGTAMRITGTDFDGNPTVLDALASKEWIRDRTPAVQRTTTNEEDTLPIDNGPLTERQTAIIGHARAGLRYRKIAEQLGISEVLVRQEVVTINRKLRATTFQQAIGIYATAMAYRGMARLLRRTSRVHAERDGVAEDHVDHVLNALADEYRSRAARLLPQ